MTRTEGSSPLLKQGLHLGGGIGNQIVRLLAQKMTGSKLRVAGLGPIFVSQVHRVKKFCYGAHAIAVILFLMFVGKSILECTQIYTHTYTLNAGILHFCTLLYIYVIMFCLFTWVYTFLTIRFCCLILIPFLKCVFYTYLSIILSSI